MILAAFNIQVTLMLPTNRQMAFWPKIDFQDGRHSGHLGFPIRVILTIFDLQVIPMLPPEFQINWPIDSGEAKNGFSR